MSNLFDDFDLDIQKVSTGGQGVSPQSVKTSETTAVSNLFSCENGCLSDCCSEYCNNTQGCQPPSAACTPTQWSGCVCDGR